MNKIGVIQPSFLEKIKARYESGEPVKAIARECGIRQKLILKYAEQEGWQKPDQNVSNNKSTVRRRKRPRDLPIEHRIASADNSVDQVKKKESLSEQQISGEQRHIIRRLLFETSKKLDHLLTHQHFDDERRLHQITRALAHIVRAVEGLDRMMLQGHGKEGDQHEIVIDHRPYGPWTSYDMTQHYSTTEETVKSK